MEYKNFNLRIESKLGDGYPVVVDSEGMGEAKGVFTLSPDCLQNATQLQDVAALEEGSRLPMTFGVSLYQCLFQKGVGIMLFKCLGAVSGEDEKGLRISLRLTPPELAALPWEALYDQESRCFLSTSEKTSLTRYIELPEPIALKIVPPIKVLALIPSGSGLDVEREERILTDALKHLGTVEIRIIKGKVTRLAISEALVEERYHILHYVGHGTFKSGQGYLLINSESNGDDLISADTFADFFRSYPSLKLVVLNSCQGAQVSSIEERTGMAPQLVARGIPAVVAMQYPISDDAALLFAREFYLKLCSGWSRGQVETAVAHARNRIHMEIKEPMAFATPVLFMRSPTGMIFDLQHEVEQKRGIFQRFSGLFNSAPAKNVSRLKQVRQTYEKNIEAWQEKTKGGSPETRKEATEAIAREKEEISAVDERIIQWNRTFVSSLLATFLIFLLGYAGLFNILHTDDWLETKFVPYMDEFLPKKFSPDVRLILADSNPAANGTLGAPGPSWRKYHPVLIDKLTEAGARVIVFDLQLDVPNPTDDKPFAEAIKRAKAQGTHVILGKGVDVEGRVTTDISAELAPAAGNEWGNYDVGGSRHGGVVRVYQLAQPDKQTANTTAAEKPLIPSLGLQAVSGFLSRNSNVKSFYSEDRDGIELRLDGSLIKTIPVYENKRSIYDFPFDLAERATLATATKSYREVYDQIQNKDFLRQQYADKIVLVGYKTPEDLFDLFKAEQRYGTEIHANIVSNILSDVYVRLLPTSYDFLIVALMVGFGALVQARWSHIFTTRIIVPFTEPKKTFALPGLLVAVDVVYLLVAFLLYKNKLIFILKTYHLVAPFIAYWLTGKMRKKTSLKLKGATS